MFSGMSSSCLPAEEERRTGDADNASSPAHSLAREPLYKVLGNKLMSKQSKPLTLVLTFMIGSAVARLKVSVLITKIFYVWFWRNGFVLPGEAGGRARR